MDAFLIQTHNLSDYFLFDLFFGLLHENDLLSKDAYYQLPIIRYIRVLEHGLINIRSCVRKKLANIVTWQKLSLISSKILCSLLSAKEGVLLKKLKLFWQFANKKGPWIIHDPKITPQWDLHLLHLFILSCFSWLVGVKRNQFDLFFNDKIFLKLLLTRLVCQSNVKIFFWFHRF